MFDFWAQIIGLFGFVFGIAAYLNQNDKALKALIALSAMTMAVHFFMLGANAGGCAAVLTSLRSFLSILQGMKPLAPVFLFAYVPLAYFKVDIWVDILPILAGILGTFSMFYLQALWMRYGLLVTTSLWFTHNLLQGSWGGILLEAFYIGANLYTIYRMKGRENEEKDVHPPPT